MAGRWELAVASFGGLVAHKERPVGGIAAAAAALRLHLSMFAMEPRACSSDGVPGTAQPTFYVPPVLCVGLQLLLRHLARGAGARSTNWRIPAFGDSTRLRMCNHGGPHTHGQYS